MAGSRIIPPHILCRTLLTALHTHGPLTAGGLVKAVGYNKRTIQKWLCRMQGAGHIKRTERMETHLVVEFTAVADPGVYVEPPPKVKARPEKRGPNGGRLHLGTEREHPLSNQGGQGALRRFNGIASSFDII